MRMHGHGAHDDMSYVPEELLAEWRDRDPIERYVERLSGERGIDGDRIEALQGRGSERRSRAAPSGRSTRRCRIPSDRHRRRLRRGAGEPLGDGQAPWSRWADDGRGEVAA